VSPMIRRRWLEGLVIVAAALATIATSGKKEWTLVVGTPQEGDSSTPRIITIEASHEPWVEALGPHQIILRPVESAPTWPGKATYLVPAKTTLGQIKIEGKAGCQGCQECKPPDSAYVRVAATTKAATWKIDMKTPPLQTTLTPAMKRGMIVQVRFVASHPPRAEAVARSRVKPVVYDGDPNQFAVTWPAVEEEMTIEWILHAWIEGPCPDERPCPPPAGAQLLLGMVTEQPP
jgi:hypothetical protein